MTESIVGFIISITPYEENDQIVKVLSTSEVISFIALGTRKPQSKNQKALDIGNLIEAEIFRARLANKLSKLKTTTLIRKNKNISFDSGSVIQIICKYLNLIDIPLVSLLEEVDLAFRALDSKSSNHHIKTWIVNRMLTSLGIQVVFDRCVECGRTSRIADFSYHKGGLLCIDHKIKTMDITLLKSYFALHYDLNTYFKTSSQNNSIIFESLSKYISETFYI